jgi:hypothetical protein
MWDPTMEKEITQEVEARLGDPRDVRDPSKPSEEDGAAITALWTSWLHQSAALLGLGFSQAALCDKTKEIANIRVEVGGVESTTGATTA